MQVVLRMKRYMVDRSRCGLRSRSLSFAHSNGRPCRIKAESLGHAVGGADLQSVRQLLFPQKPKKTYI
jgi:hypothetical protein